MKIQLRQGTDSFKLTAQSFKRAYLLIQSVGDAPASVPTTQDVNLSNLNITIELHQQGETYLTSFNGVAPAVLGALKSKNPQSVVAQNWDATGVSLQGNVVPVATGTPFVNEVYIPLLWDGYNLKEGDYCKFTTTTIGGFFGGANSNNSSFYIIVEEGLDVNQVDVNIPVYYPITIDKTNPQFNESMVSEIYVLNSVPTYSLNIQPFRSIEVRSKEVNDAFDLYTLETLSNVYGYGRFFDYGSNQIYNFEPSRLSDVLINLDVNTSVVTNGANWLFVSRVCANEEVAKNAIERSERINFAKANQVGLTRGISSAPRSAMERIKWNKKYGR
jgi:hypothetical protein